MNNLLVNLLEKFNQLGNHGTEKQMQNNLISDFQINLAWRMQHFWARF